MALYDEIGRSYRAHRVPDIRIAKQISHALGDAKTIVNIGAGTGSYEPTQRDLIAVEPSSLMISQRPIGSAPAIQASAEHLPFADKRFDASMAILTIHHWTNWRKGLEEMIRVSNKVVIFTWDPNFEGFWLTKDYFPEILRIDQSIFPSVDKIAEMFPQCTVETTFIPHNCTDGFGSAYWRRPEAYLNEGVRNAMSTFTKLRGIEPTLLKLEKDLASGLWHKKYGSILSLPEMDLGYRLIVGTVKM